MLFRVKLVPFALVIATLLMGTAATGSAAGATESMSLGAAEETGPEPAPLFEPDAVDDPVSFKVTYSATPVQAIEIRQGLNCVRGSEAPGVPEEPETVTPPVSISLTAPAGSDSCSLTASAETLFSGVFGTVRIEGEAILASKPQSTPPPKKRCKKGKRLRHGKCVKGKKKHPHARLSESPRGSVRSSRTGSGGGGGASAG